jgi:hypothetical protein
MIQFNEMTAEQRRVFIDTEQLHRAYQAAVKSSEAYKGGMHWKRSKGHQYLFKTTDRLGNGKSLGPRSSATEKIKLEFQQGKKKSNDRISQLKANLKNQARFVKAARIQRVPVTLARILRVLEREGLLGKNTQVIGTNALYAYESMAGVFLDRAVTATQDADILWDIRPRLILVSGSETGRTGFLNLLHKADRSFEPTLPGGYRAANKNGYLVDLIKAEPRPATKNERKQMELNDDLSAAEIKNLQWFLSSPRIEQVVIGEDGFPASLVVPDPRAFAVHKMWLSQQNDREPLKKTRDKEQAITTFQLVIKYLPQYEFKSSDLKMFPKQLLDEYLELFKKEMD